MLKRQKTANFGAFAKASYNTVFKFSAQGATPYIFTGARIGIGTVLIVVIVSEMIAVNNGLGYRILEAREVTYPPPEVVMSTIDRTGHESEPKEIRTGRGQWLLNPEHRPFVQCQRQSDLSDTASGQSRSGDERNQHRYASP